MNILAIDTSTWALAVAVSQGGRLAGEINSYLAKNHAARLMPAVHYLLDSLDLAPSDLDLIAVGSGPGSYTGVRIGVTAAKTIAWALKLPLLGLSSLQAIAQNKADFAGLIVPLMDARRGQVYAGLYRGRQAPLWSAESTLESEKMVKKGWLAPQSGSWLAAPVARDRIQPLEELLKEVEDRLEGDAALFVGPGVAIHGQKIKETLGERAILAEPEACSITGRALADLAWQYRDQRTEKIHTFVPRYLQLAEAEKKWMERQG